MNQPVYQPAPYPPAPPQGVYPPQTAQAAPSQPAAALPYPPQASYGYAPAPYPQGPYGQGAYPPAPVNYYGPSAGQPTPRFTVAAPKDPRKLGGRRMMNLMSLLILLQSLLSVGVQLAAMAVSAAAGSTLLYTDSLALLWLTLALSPLSTALPFFVFMLFGKKDWGQYLRFEKTGFFTGLLTVFAGLGLCLLADYPAYGVEVLLEFLGASGMSAAAPEITSMEGFWLELAGIAVLVPLMEEFAFRGALLSALRKYGTGFAITGSALLFGMAHTSLTSVVFATLSGLVLGFIYAKTNNLWLTVAVHALNNALSVVISNVDLLFPSGTAAIVSETVPMALIGLGALCLVLLLIFRRRQIFGRKEAEANPAFPPLRAGESIGCIVKAPIFWGVAGMVAVGTAALFL